MADRPALRIEVTGGTRWSRGRGRHSTRARSSDGVWSFERNSDRVASGWWVTFTPWGHQAGLVSLQRARRGGHELLMEELLLTQFNGRLYDHLAEAARVREAVWGLIEQANKEHG